MPRRKGAATRLIGIEDRGGDGEKRFRLRYVLDGEGAARCFASRAEAARWGDKLLEGASEEAGPTVTEMLDDWLAERKAHGDPVHRHHRRSVIALLGRDTSLMRLQLLRQEHVESGYTARVGDGVSAATHRNELAITKQFLQWCVKRKHLKRDPSAQVEAVGRRRRGKPQIETRGELGAFTGLVWQEARAGHRIALGVLISLYQGLRPGEVCGLLGRHVDIGARLVVPGTKTVNARRSLPVASHELYQLMFARAGIVGPEGKLVDVSVRHFLRCVKAYAAEAGVSNATVLTAQGLRGQHASVAVTGGASIEAVAAALGHGASRVTREHYATLESQATARVRNTWKVLDGGIDSGLNPSQGEKAA